MRPAPAQPAWIAIDASQFHQRVCYAAAARALRDRLGGRPVARAEREHYVRIVAACCLSGVDVNAWMVSHSWGFAYRRYSR